MEAEMAKNGRHTVVARIYAKKWSFLVVFLVVLFVVVGLCIVTGFIPNPPSTTLDTESQSNTSDQQVSPLMVGPLAALQQDTSEAPRAQSENVQTSGEMPVKIVVPSIGLSATIANPESTNVETLDDYLLHGAVRYPTSATLGQSGNVILFGHSSYLPVVINHAYKTFDGIQNLKAGDHIVVYSNAHQYVYAVSSVQKENSAVGSIPLTTTGHMITLATCNSFGTKSDRFVVTAILVGSYALGN